MHLRYRLTDCQEVHGDGSDICYDCYPGSLSQGCQQEHPYNETVHLVSGKRRAVASASFQPCRVISISRLSPMPLFPVHLATTPPPRGMKSLRRMERVMGSLQMGQFVFCTATTTPEHPGHFVSARIAAHLCPDRHSLKEQGSWDGRGGPVSGKGQDAFPSGEGRGKPPLSPGDASEAAGGAVAGVSIGDWRELITV